MLQMNANGLRPKLDNIVYFMEVNNISVAAIQESNLSDSSV